MADLDFHQLEFHPLTLEYWDDFECLFGRNGVCGGCWCMWWHLKRSEFNALRGDGTRQAIKAKIESGHVPGLLAYYNRTPVGWVAVGLRSSFAGLGRSRTFKPLDDRPVWSIVCFFIDRQFRKRDMTPYLISGAEQYARANGAKMLEGYPGVPEKRTDDGSIFMGTLSSFRKAGFLEVYRPSPRKVIVRKEL